MKNFVKYLCGFAVAATLSFSGSVFAAATQADADDYRCPGKKPYYDRTDGLCYEKGGKTPVMMGNGVPSIVGGAASYKHTFDDGATLKGLFCQDSASPGTNGSCAGNTTLVECLCTFNNGTKLVWFPLLTATIDSLMTATGFNIGGDQVSNDGNGIYGGLNGGSGRPFTVGEDSFYFCMELNVDDVSGIDASFAGFAKVTTGTAWNADSEAITDYAGIGIEGTAASGLTVEDVIITTELNNAGVSETDTTDSAADTVTHKYCTYVASTGVTTFTFDDAAPTTTATFTFDDGDMVVPYFSYLHTADLAGAVDIVSWEVGTW